MKIYYEDEYVTLYHGDSRDLEREEGTVVITDPPFNVGYHYKTHKDRMETEEYERLIRATCVPPCVVVHYPEAMFNVSKWLDMIPDRCVSWVYPSNTERQQRTLAWFGTKPNFSLMGQPYRNPGDKRIKRLMAQGKQAKLYDWWEINQVKNCGGEKTKHPCQMPLEVMRRAVGITEGDIVCDPFAGSGTTLLAAASLGRRAVGVEVDEAYCEITAGRLSEFIQEEKRLCGN